MLICPEAILRYSRGPTPAHRIIRLMYMTYEVQMAPNVPWGMAVTGSRSEEARLAPERIPVKHLSHTQSVPWRQWGLGIAGSDDLGAV